MKFKKGNPGKPKGAKNKTTKELRETISNFLIENFDQVQEDFQALDPKDRTKLYCDLLQYGLPKLQAVSNVFQFEDMTDEQLETIIHELKNQNLYTIP